MKIDNEFSVGVPIDQAWDVLTDLAGIAPCLPGASLTGVEDDVYTGKVKIKVGPVTSEYSGTARFAEKDDDARRAVIDAKGKDVRGAGNANARIQAQLAADGERTVVTVATDLDITGKIAQFGSGMIREVSEKLLGQFATNLEARLLAPEPAAPPVEHRPAPRPTAVPAAAASDPEPIDLLSVAGSSVGKRLVPPLVAGLLLVLLVVRRRGR